MKKYIAIFFPSGIMGGSPCPIEVMKQVITKLHMPQVTVGSCCNVWIYLSKSLFFFPSSVNCQLNFILDLLWIDGDKPSYRSNANGWSSRNESFHCGPSASEYWGMQCVQTKGTEHRNSHIAVGHFLISQCVFQVSPHTACNDYGYFWLAPRLSCLLGNIGWRNQWKWSTV